MGQTAKNLVRLILNTPVTTDEAIEELNTAVSHGKRSQNIAAFVVLRGEHGVEAVLNDIRISLAALVKAHIDGTYEEAWKKAAEDTANDPVTVANLKALSDVQLVYLIKKLAEAL